MKEPKQQCPEFPHFGANYPDARCIDGYLWDLDSFEDGGLTSGGDDPCPFCNPEFKQDKLDDGLSIEEINAYIENLKNRYEKQL